MILFLDIEWFLLVFRNVIKSDVSGGYMCSKKKLRNRRKKINSFC